MAKTASEVEKAPRNQVSKKQIKKQAKREAKLQRKLDQVRRVAQKAEKKVSRAQSRLTEAQAQVYTLEEQIAQYRTSKQSPNGTPADGDNTHQPQAEQVPLEVLAVEPTAPATADGTITEASQEALPSAEKHTDAPAEQIVAEISETAEVAEDKSAADTEHATSEEEKKAVAQEDESGDGSSAASSDETSTKEQ